MILAGMACTMGMGSLRAKNRQTINLAERRAQNQLEASCLQLSFFAYSCAWALFTYSWMELFSLSAGASAPQLELSLSNYLTAEARLLTVGKRV